MRIEILRGIGGPVIIEDASRVLIAGDDGTPAVVACEWAPGVVIAARAGEPDFNQVLAALGVDRTTVVARMATSEIEV